MRVLLVDPPDMFLDGKGTTRQALPMGLAAVAAAARPHHDVALLLPDTRAYTGADPFGEIERAAVAWAPDVVGVTSVTATFPSAKRVIERLSRALPDVPIVLGGVHATFRPDEAARVPGVFAVVAGEGDHAFVELLAGLERARAGAPFDPTSIAGVHVFDDAAGRVRTGAERTPIADLDALPFPERDALLWKEDVHPALYQALITLRGCPYRCIYCSVPNGPEGKTRYRSPSKVVDEIELVRDRHAANYLFFHDSVFTLHRRRTLEIVDELERRGVRIPFACQTRADRVDEELLDRLVAVGLHQVFFGIESGDRASLKLI